MEGRMEGRKGGWMRSLVDEFLSSSYDLCLYLENLTKQ